MRFSFAALALLPFGVMATPPACLLACIAQVTKPGPCKSIEDYDCVCSGTSANNIADCLNSKCPNGNEPAALSAFKSSCSERGKDINLNIVSSGSVSSITSGPSSPSSNIDSDAITSSSDQDTIAVDSASSTESVLTTPAGSVAESSKAVTSTTVASPLQSPVTIAASGTGIIEGAATRPSGSKSIEALIVALAVFLL